MSYVDDNLVPGERVTYRAHLHWKTYMHAVPFVVLAIVAATLGTMVEDRSAHLAMLWAAVASAVAAGALFLVAWVKSRSYEFAVTDKRVIIKTGMFNRRTMETLLTKVENISVDQKLWGRLLGYGTIRVTGTGGTTEPFADIANPLEFRKHVQAQTISYEERRDTVHDAPPAAALTLLARDERECPYCAERILAKARVCRFCNREITPA
ncbi:MAG: PH domain-containing protein [Gemmatimonadaceae bacterium]